jgi:SAM-dependent methyltransferase
MQRPRFARSHSEIQRRYYEQSAENYDDVHVREGDAHFVALGYISAFLAEGGYRSIVDVGCGTGRGIRYLASRHQDLLAVGVEPSAALISRGQYEVTGATLLRGTGNDLPLRDGSVDAAMALGVLHHVADPNAVIEEMTRVARHAIFVSDSNRFGQGRPAVRCLKLALWLAGLWGIVNFAKTRGRGYIITEGDGLSYSYSVYDSYATAARWSSRLILIGSDPTSQGRGWIHPLLTSSHILLCAFHT